VTDVNETYGELQSTDGPHRDAELAELKRYASAWQDDSIPQQQGRIADIQLRNLRQGIVDPVFAALIRSLERIPEAEFSILDAACASGYYSEVIALAKPGAAYTGSDYSEAMIAEARRRYPDRTFRVENACRLSLADRSFDCVLLSGAIEHIPDYDRAIAEICRVARRWVLLHRVPMILARKARMTLSTQYQVETPRIFLPHGEIVARMAAGGFVLRDERAVYRSGLRHEIARRLRRRRPDIRTLLFERKG
jgi:SAM-dependent methyltransferase